MKKALNLEQGRIIFYSMNLCSRDDVGDYELFADRELHLDVEKLLHTFSLNSSIKWSSYAAQFVIAETKVTLYSEGRVLLEGVKPDTHEQAFAILAEILGKK